MELVRATNPQICEHEMKHQIDYVPTSTDYGH